MKKIFALLLAFALAPAFAQSSNNAGVTNQLTITQTIRSSVGDNRGHGPVATTTGLSDTSMLPGAAPSKETLDGQPPEFYILGSQRTANGVMLSVWTNLKQFRIGQNVYGSNKPMAYKVLVPDTGGQDYIQREVLLNGKQY